MRDRDEIEPFGFEDVRRRCRLRPVCDADPAVGAVGHADLHFALGAFVRRDPQRVARSDDKRIGRVVFLKDVERLPGDVERLRERAVAEGDGRDAVRRKRDVGIESVAYGLHRRKDGVRLRIFDLDLKDVAPEVPPFDAQRRDNALERQGVKMGGSVGAVVLPVRDSVAVKVRPAEVHEAEVSDG